MSETSSIPAPTLPVEPATGTPKLTITPPRRTTAQLTLAELRVVLYALRTAGGFCNDIAADLEARELQ